MTEEKDLLNAGFPHIHPRSILATAVDIHALVGGDRCRYRPRGYLLPVALLTARAVRSVLGALTKTLLFLSQPTHRPGFFKAALKVVVAEDRALGGPGGPSGTATLQNRSYAHRAQVDRASRKGPGAEYPAYPRLILSAAPKEGGCGGTIR